MKAVDSPTRGNHAYEDVTHIQLSRIRLFTPKKDRVATASEIIASVHIVIAQRSSIYRSPKTPKSNTSGSRPSNSSTRRNAV